MIRNEAEYHEASARLAEERKRLADHRGRLKEAGLSLMALSRHGRFSRRLFVNSVFIGQIEIRQCFN